MSDESDKISEEQLSKLSDADLEFYSNDQLDKMSDAGLEIVQSIPEPVGSPQPQEGQDKGGLPGFLDMGKGFASGVTEALTLDKIKDAFPNTSPTSKDLGYVAGNVGTGIGEGLLALKLLGKKGGSALARVLTNMGITGGESAIRSSGSENQGMDTAFNAGLAGGLSGTSELLQSAGPPSLRWAGRILGGLSPVEASLFKANPQKASHLSRLLNERPAQFSKEIQTLLKGARTTGGYTEGLAEMLRRVSTNPMKAKKAQALSLWGRDVSMPWSVFENANPEVQAEALRIARLNAGFPNAQKSVTRTPINSGEHIFTDVSQGGLPLDTKEVIPGDSLGIKKTQYDYDAEQLGLPLRQQSGPMVYPYKDDLSGELSKTISPGTFEQQLPLNLNETANLKFDPIDSNTSYGRLATQEQYGLPLTVKQTSTSARQFQTPKTIVLTPTQQSRLMQLSGDGAFKEANKAFPIAPKDATASKAQYDVMQADKNVYSSVRKAQEEKALETILGNRANQIQSMKSGQPDMYSGHDRSVEFPDEIVPEQFSGRSKILNYGPDVKYRPRDMDIPELNDNISDDVNILNKIEESGTNLKSLVTAGPKTEAADMRAYIDSRTGSNISSLANLLSAGEKLTRKKGVSGLSNYLRRPVSSALVRTPNVPPLAREMIGLPALQAILRSTTGSMEGYD